MRPDFYPPPGLPEPGNGPERISKPINLGWLLFLLAATGLAGWQCVGSRLGSQPDGWLHDMGAGMSAAETTGKPMFVLYTADWCPPCRELKRNVLSDPKVDAFLKEKYVRVKIDLTDRGGANARTASEYGVRGIPTMILYDDGGQESQRVTGGSDVAYWLQRHSDY